MLLDRSLLPRVPRSLLARPGLDRRLDRWAPVTVVRGPRGYGKTVLVASWLERQQGPTVVPVWVAAGPGPGDPEPLWAEIRHRLDGAGLLAGASASGDRAGLRLDIPPGVRVVLVVDDFQHVRRPDVLDDLVGLARTYRGLHLVVCHRSWHPIQSLAVATVGAEVVGPTDLLLSAEDIVALAAAMGKPPLPLEDAEELRQALGGWPAPVRLVVDGYDGGRLPMPVAEEFLRTTVLPQVEATEGIDHLTRFALARRLDRDLVRDLCDDPYPDRFVEVLESPGLLERRQHGDRVELVPPGLLTAVLRQAYTARYPDEARAFHRRLAAWYGARDQPDDALLSLQHAVDGEDWEQAKRIWTLHGPTLRMLAPGPFRQALDAIPADALVGHPAILIDRQVSGTADADSDLDGRMDTIRTYFTSSTQMMQRPLDGLPAPDLVYLGTGHLIGLRMRGRLADSDRFAQTLARRVSATVQDAEAAVDGLGWFNLQWGLTRTLLGDDAGAVQAYRRAWACCNRVPANWIAANVAANLALSYAVRGDAAQARQWLNRYRRFETSDQWAHYLVSIGAHLTDGLLALDRLDEDGVQAALAHLGDGTSPVELWPYVAWLRAQHALYFGDPASGLADLDDADRAHPGERSGEQSGEWPGEGVAAQLLARSRVDLLMASGHGAQAAAVLEGWEPSSPMAAVPAARLALLDGEDPAARSAAARSFATPRMSRRDRLDLLVVQAEAARRMGDLMAARRLFDHAAGAYGPSGLPRALATVAPAVRDDLLAAAGRQLAPADRDRLDRRPPAFPERFAHLELTKRERAVLVALERTASRQAMADELYVSVNTVKTQLTALYKKLDTTNRTEALLKAHQLGLLP
ncbi:MAG TPA: LuxR C-terminal-related transcriptional regulator [Acidimicrobiales bacterium]|nr:LuxR C-terminal-related transcriptional regulator [Acidimicrobiales bacterium]